MSMTTPAVPPRLVVDGSGDAMPMLDALQGFVHELRTAGLPVSMTENLDAMRALEFVSIADREMFRAALAATLVKHAPHRRAFDTVFDVYFSLHSGGVTNDGDTELPPGLAEQQNSGEGGGAMGELSREDLAKMLLAALRSKDRESLRRIASVAVGQFAGMESGRPVGGTYYLYRTLRQLNLDAVLEELMNAPKAGAQGCEGTDGTAEAGNDGLGERLLREEFEARIKELKEMVEAEIRRRLVADRGVAAMARTLRKPLPEDIDFMHASREEMLALHRAVYPLTRALAARLAQRRRRRNRGALDFRATVRHSLSYGGVPAEPKFRRPRPSKPEVMVIADISGSVASFARFTLQFVYAMASQFSKVRSWVFIDGIDEVTSFFTECDDITDAIHRVNTEANVVWIDGHSDYGHAFEMFHGRHLSEVTPKTTVIILGDARNNYHASQAWVIAELRQRARHVYWLDPEPKSYWDMGDSIVSDYGRYCDGVYECRNLRQLESFVSTTVSS